MDDHGDDQLPDRSAAPSERVRIIGADEARLAMERGQSVGRAGAPTPGGPGPDPRFAPSMRLGGSSFGDADDDADDDDGDELADARGIERSVRGTGASAPVAAAGPRRVIGADERLAQTQAERAQAAQAEQAERARAERAQRAEAERAERALDERALRAQADAQPDPGRAEASTRLPHWTEPATGQMPRIFGDEPDDDEGDAWSKVSAPRFRHHSGDWAEPDFHPDELIKDDDALGALSDDEPDVDEDDVFARQVQERRARGAERRPGGGAGRRTARGGPSSVQPGAIDDDADAEGPLLGGGPGLGTGQLRAEPDFGPPEMFNEPSRPDDLVVRIVVGVAMGIVALLAFNLGRGWVAALASVIGALATAELYAGSRSQGYRPAALLGMIGAAAMPAIAFKRGPEAFPLVIGIIIVFTMLWYLTGAVRARPVANLGMTYLGFGYIGMLAGFVGLLLGRSVDGVGLVIGVALCVVVNDIAAYLVGSHIGHQRLAPHISPNKTWAGFFAGVAGSIAVAVLGVHEIAPWDTSRVHCLWLGLVVGLAAPIGDLAESMIKRDLGIKDFGGLLPGHGGVFDRFDGLLFSMPFAYYLTIVLDIG